MEMEAVIMVVVAVDAPKHATVTGVVVVVTAAV